MPSSSSSEDSVRIRAARARRVRCVGARVTVASSFRPRADLSPEPAAAGVSRTAPGPAPAAPPGPSAAARAARALEAIAAALERRAQLDRRAIEALRARVIDIGLRVAARVVRREIDAGRHDAFAIVEETLGHTATPGDAEVRLHPADERALREGGRAATLLERGVRLVGDAAVPRGECTIRSGGGTVERRVSDALDALRRSLETADDTEEGAHA